MTVVDNEKPVIDQYFYLLGDGEGAIHLMCRVCDRGGRPIAYYTDRGDKAFANTDVAVVYEISELMLAGKGHVAFHRR